jgi:hypothetical protein
MEHSWTVFCHRVIADKETNRLTLVDTIEKVAVGVKNLPAYDGLVVFQLECVLVSHWSRSDFLTPEASKMRITLLNPKDETIPFTDPSPLVLDVDLTEHATMRTQNQLGGLPLGDPGRYVFHVEMLGAKNKWQTVARVPYQFFVEVTDKPSHLHPDTGEPRKDRIKSKKRSQAI